MYCLIVLNKLGNSEASLVRIFVLYFQMLCIIPEIILNFAQQERKNSFLFKLLRKGDFGLVFILPSSEVMQQISTWP